jgi:hypothetical protein
MARVILHTVRVTQGPIARTSRRRVPQVGAAPGARARKPTWIDERDALALHDRLLVLPGASALAILAPSSRH